MNLAFKKIEEEIYLLNLNPIFSSTFEHNFFKETWVPLFFFSVLETEHWDEVKALYTLKIQFPIVSFRDT